MSDLDGTNDNVVVNKLKKPNLTLQQRKELASYFMLRSKDGDGGLKLERGTLVKAAKKFDISRQRASTLYNEGRNKYNVCGVFSLTPGKPTGRPLKHDVDELRDAIRVLPPYKKKSIRSIASEIGIPKSTMGRYKMKADETDDPIIRRHTNAIKPELTPEHQIARVHFALSKLNLVDGKWHDMYDEVHVDEKWFFLTESELQMYITPGEVVPNRRTPGTVYTCKRNVILIS